MKKIKLLLYLFLFIFLHNNQLYSQTYAKQSLTKLDSAQILKYTENYKIYLAKSNLRNASDFLNQIAEIYWNRNHFEESAEYYQKSLNLNAQLGNENGMAGINSNLGMIYSDLGQYQESVNHLLDAVTTRRKEKNTVTGRENLFNALLNLSSSYKQLNKYDESIKYLEEALSYAQEINNLEKIAIFYLQLAEVHESAGNQTESKKYLDKYMTFYKQMQDEEVARSHMATENERLRSEQIALEKRLQELELIEKTVKLEESEKKVEVYSSKADSLANTLTKAQLATKLLEKQAEQERLEQQKNNIIFGFIFSFVVIIAIGLYYAFYQKKKANVELANKNSEILRQQEEIIAQRDMLNESNKDLDRSNKELDRKNNQIMKSISYAKLIQTAMLKSEISLSSYVPESFILFKPRDIVSGDFYWYTKIKNKLIIATIDCTGHGVPGAFMSMIGANLLNQIVLNDKITEPHDILENLHLGVNQALSQELTENDDGMDGTIMIFDDKKKTISFSGAQNSLIIIKDGILEEVDGDSLSIGGTQRQKDEKFTKKEIQLSGNTFFYSFSDGYQDQFGGIKDRKFMGKKMQQLLLDINQKSMEEQKAILDITIEDWKKEGRSKQTDDILVIGMNINYVI